MTKADRPLTDTQIRSLAGPVGPATQTDIRDVRSPGLFLRVTVEAKTWTFRFTCPVTGKRLRMRLARYPDMSLADARDRAADLRKLVAKGVNPIEAKRQERTEAPKRTFGALAERYTREHATRFKRSAGADVRNLRLHVLPQWGSRQYADISRANIIELVEGLIAAGKPALANRVQALVSKIFSFAIDADLVDANPATRLRKRGKETAVTRVLNDDEIRLFWSKISSPPLLPATGIALKLALSTGLRAGEVAGLHRGELVDLENPDQAAILIPAARIKNKRDFLVPLSPLARQLVLQAQELAGDSAFLFPSRYGKAAGIDPHALATAMARFAAGLADDAPGAATWKANPPTPHDLRRSCATRLAALGVAREDRLAVLNHKEGDVHAAHYDRYERAREKRAALSLWAAALVAVLDGGKGAGNVVPMRRQP